MGGPTPSVHRYIAIVCGVRVRNRLEVMRMTCAYDSRVDWYWPCGIALLLGLIMLHAMMCDGWVCV